MNTLAPEAKKAAAPRRAPVLPERVGVLQRKCACGGGAASGGECEECKKEKLQRRKGQGEDPENLPGIVHDVLGSSGRPMDSATRAFMEPRFGHDFGSVRVHADDQAAESARAVNALAYTVGRDVVFGAGQYAPSRSSGQRLLAHELTHVVQQRHAGRNLQRKLELGQPNDTQEHEADRTADQVVGGAATAPAGIIAEDAARQVGPGQMRKTEFLDKLRAHVCAVADSVLVSVGRTAKGCPVIEKWIGHLHQRNAQYIERALRKYASPAPQAGAQEFITAVGERVREGVTRWARTGDISGVPPELMSEMAGGGIAGAIGSVVSGIAGAAGGAISGIGKLFAKGNDGGARAGNPVAIQAQLGGGSPLESGVQARMESAFGYSFSRVRVHNDPKAGRLSSGLNARAFTIGRDVAFASGEYRPGTLIGDALIAHELAHVIQQGSGTPAGAMAKGEAEYSSLEADADMSAVGAMISSRGGDIRASAMPSLRSGLKLQRCGGFEGMFEKAEDKPATECTAEDLGTHVKDCMENANWHADDLASGVRYAIEYRQDCIDKRRLDLWVPTYMDGYADLTYFTRLAPFDWRLKAGVSASAGIKTWLAGLTIADCGSTVWACEYDAFRAAVGDSKFDEQFGSATKEIPDNARMRIMSGNADIPLRSFMVATDAASTQDFGTIGNRPAKIGEWYYFENHPMYRLKHPGGDWQGENAVYGGRNQAGEQVWTGLGADQKTERQLLDELVESYNSEPSGYDRSRLEAIKQANGGKLPPEFTPGFYPDQIDVAAILNATPYTIVDPINHKDASERFGGFRGEVGMKLDEKKVEKVKDE